MNPRGLDILHIFVADMALGKSETRFPGPVRDLFEQGADILVPSEQPRSFDGIGSALMLVNLSLHLQGRPDLSLDIVERFEAGIARFAHGRVDEAAKLQQQITRARLLRSVGRYGDAQACIERLVQVEGPRMATGARTIGADPDPDARAGGGDPPDGPGDLSRVLQDVYWNENAKCLWAQREIEQCLAFTSTAPPGNAVCLELSVKCMIRQGALDKAIAIGSQHCATHPWLAAYIVMSFIAGSAIDAATAVAAVVEELDEVINLRVAIEWLAAGQQEAGVRHARIAARKARMQGNEQLLLLADTVLVLASAPADHDRDALVLALDRTLHNATRIVCFTALAMEGDVSARVCAAKLLDVVSRELVRNSAGLMACRDLIGTLNEAESDDGGRCSAVAGEAGRAHRETFDLAQRLIGAIEALN